MFDQVVQLWVLAGCVSRVGPIVFWYSFELGRTHEMAIGSRGLSDSCCCGIAFLGRLSSASHVILRVRMGSSDDMWGVSGVLFVLWIGLLVLCRSSGLCLGLVPPSTCGRAGGCTVIV